MLQFVIRKMLNKKWMILALLVGNILLVSIAAANPMYTGAILQRTFESVMADSVTENGTCPMTYTVETIGLFSNIEDIHTSGEVLRSSGERYGLPVKETVAFYELLSHETVSNLDRTDRRQDASIASLSNLRDHIRLIEGRI